MTAIVFRLNIITIVQRLTMVTEC